MSLPFHKKGRYTSYALSAQLPHPKLAPEVFITIHRVLIRAFEILREEGQPLATMIEPAITRNLAKAIENRLRQTHEIPGFASPFFERVTREHECDNFDGTLEEKYPDLFFSIRPDDSFRSRIQSDQWGVFVECKPVDKKHKIGAKDMYLSEGIHRFVRGDYAWAMQDAMMVAFTRDGFSISQHLAPILSQRDELHLSENIAAFDEEQCPVDERHEALHTSTHRRPFVWSEGRGPACPITLYHSWHDCTHPGDPHFIED